MVPPEAAQNGTGKEPTFCSLCSRSFKASSSVPSSRKPALIVPSKPGPPNYRLSHLLSGTLSVATYVHMCPSIQLSVSAWRARLCLRRTCPPPPPPPPGAPHCSGDQVGAEETLASSARHHSADHTLCKRGSPLLGSSPTAMHAHTQRSRQKSSSTKGSFFHQNTG